MAEAIAAGHLPNALFHFRVFSTKPGQQNGADAQPERDTSPAVQRKLPRTEPVQSRDIKPAIPKSLGPASVDAVVTSPTGAIFVIGWAADRQNPLHKIWVQFENGDGREWPAAQLIRFRRTDAEEALGLQPTRRLGFCALLFPESEAGSGTARPRAITLSGSDGSSTEFPVTPRLVTDVELRDMMLGYLSSVNFMGNPHVESFYALDDCLGQALIRHSRNITRSIVRAATIERFDAKPADRFKGSIVVCLYGKGEFQFVQNALFSAGAGAEDYEYIYVSNSPELIEMLCKTAQISRRTYGLNVSVVMLPGNAGFGAANNIAAQHARSRRLLIVNPDVFPMEQNWATRHNEAVEQLPAEQTKLFGPRMFYADGSLMHAGMYVDIDWGTSVADFELRRRPMLRVEHYGKGAPKNAEMFRGSRPVSAVSGAFMSMDRGWFERIGGFAEDYIFAYYEDADLCLRSWDKGAPAWIHELDFCHLEGKGSSTPLPHHKGAALVNRWLFTREWHGRVAGELLGRVAPKAPSQLRVAS
ncbi:MAG: glycosyltransferase family 2 protein [Alphaproteobacteria bacterium]|nr:glycosyltransferase family 2 protein [Alphaproteobacteria bacterium]